MRELVLIAHDIRSTHNVGSLLRTAEGLGVTHLYFTGYTPYPRLPAQDDRLPHISEKLTAQIDKTALGAAGMIPWSNQSDVLELIAKLKSEEYEIVALEQAKNSVPLPSYVPTGKTAILLGREVEGIATDLLAACDVLVEIPMFGKKESFNVVQAAAMMLCHCRFAA
jgi:23S rRNA (guanosine2251-2'-O)-methyltransferase